MRASLISLVVLLTPDAALACGRSELYAFVEAAQQLEERAEQMGPKLLGCPAETAEAAQWLAFYRAVKTPPPKAPPSVPIAKAQTNVAGEVGRAIAAAYAGNVAPLRTQLDAGHPEYKATPEAALAVGRMLVRQRQFADGRRYYEDFLRLRNGPAEEAEYLFTFIWEGDLRRADEELSSARGHAYLMASARRGRQLVARLESNKAPASAAGLKGGKRAALLSAGGESFVIKDQLRRYGSLVHFQGIVDASWRHHLLQVQAYDQPSLNTDELRIGRVQPLGDHVSLAAHASYVVHAKKHLGGTAAVRFRLPGVLTLGAGGERRHLYATVPLAEEALGLTQDTLWLEAGWDEYVVLRSSQLEDDGGSPFERHELSLRLPLGAEAAALALAGYEARAVPSPDYDTYRKTQRLGVGFSFKRSIGEQWDGLIEAIYLLRLRQPYGDSKYLQHSGVDLKGEVGSLVGESLRFAGQLVYAAEETERPTGKVEHRIGVMASLQLLN
jgi:hypothetical protein